MENKNKVLSFRLPRNDVQVVWFLAFKAETTRTAVIRAMIQIINQSPELQNKVIQLAVEKNNEIDEVTK